MAFASPRRGTLRRSLSRSPSHSPVRRRSRSRSPSPAPDPGPLEEYDVHDKYHNAAWVSGDAEGERWAAPSAVAKAHAAARLAAERLAKVKAQWHAYSANEEMPPVTLNVEGFCQSMQDRLEEQRLALIRIMHASAHSGLTIRRLTGPIEHDASFDEGSMLYPPGTGPSIDHGTSGTGADTAIDDAVGDGGGGGDGGRRADSDGVGGDTSKLLRGLSPDRPVDSASQAGAVSPSVSPNRLTMSTVAGGLSASRLQRKHDALMDDMVREANSAAAAEQAARDDRSSLTGFGADFVKVPRMHMKRLPKHPPKGQATLSHAYARYQAVCERIQKRMDEISATTG